MVSYIAYSSMSTWRTDDKARVFSDVLGNSELAFQSVHHLAIPLGTAAVEEDQRQGDGVLHVLARGEVLQLRCALRKRAVHPERISWCGREGVYKGVCM